MMLGVYMVCSPLDESSEQKPEGRAESASEKDVNGTGAHGVRLR